MACTLPFSSKAGQMLASAFADTATLACHYFRSLHAFLISRHFKTRRANNLSSTANKIPYVLIIHHSQFSIPSPFPSLLVNFPRYVIDGSDWLGFSIVAHLLSLFASSFRSVSFLEFWPQSVLPPHNGAPVDNYRP